MASREVYLTILEKGNGYRKLIRVADRGKQEVLIVIPALSMNYSVPNPYSTREQVGKESVLENRWSIHPSNKSPKQINFLKKTTRTAEKEFESGLLVTSAIKSKSGFQPIMTRRCPRMREAVFDVRDTATVNIGTYDPEHLQLLLALYVGHRDVPFIPQVTVSDMSIWVVEVATYRIVLLASFFRFPAFQGNVREVITKDPGPEFEGPFGLSMTPDECIRYFIDERQSLAIDTFTNHPDVINSEHYTQLIAKPSFTAKHPVRGKLLSGQSIMIS